MSKGNTWENDLLKLIFNATAIANIAANAASSPLTNLYVSLHTADPGEAGDQTTSEATYTSYARVAVARTSGGFTVTGNSVSPWQISTSQRQPAAQTRSPTLPSARLLPARASSCIPERSPRTSRCPAGDAAPDHGVDSHRGLIGITLGTIPE